MGEVRNYKDLIAWQKGMDLVETVYRVSGQFPSDERFGLVSQMRRAVISIPSNIAEGYTRRGRADYLRFLDIARGSANEIETQVIAAVRLDFIKEEDAKSAIQLINEVQKILKGLVNSLNNKFSG